MSDRKKPEDLRSARWFAPDDLRGFGHRSRAMQQGYAPIEWKDRPVIAILNTWSDAQPCHMHFKTRVDDVKRGILMAGGFPMELPALSLSEMFLKPTTMLYRNMLAMDAEELLRGHPVDGVVLMGGCDKTTPGLLLGATSAGYPAIYLPAGPMLRGNWKGKTLGSGSDAWKFWDERRAGKITEQPEMVGDDFPAVVFVVCQPLIAGRRAARLNRTCRVDRQSQCRQKQQASEVFSSRHHGVPMKSRLPTSTPLWRRML